VAAVLLGVHPAQEIVEAEFSRLSAVFPVDKSRDNRTSAVDIDRRGINGHADPRVRRGHRQTTVTLIDVYTAHTFKGKPTGESPLVSIKGNTPVEVDPRGDL
jgi:hypothetical protein